MARRSGARNGLLLLAVAGLLLALLGTSFTGASGVEVAAGDQLGQRIYITEAADEFGRRLVPAGARGEFVLPEVETLAPRAQFATAGDAPAKFIVSYLGFPPEARQAMQAAVGVWAQNLSSPVPLHIDAYWADLGPGVLGASGPRNFWRNVPGAPADGLFRPSALANRYAGRDLDPNTSDMVVYVNSTAVRWYFGTDGKPPAGTYDLFTVVLHEISHGLGIADSGEDDYGSEGRVGTFSGPTVFDSLLYSEDGSQLISMLYPSVDLYDLFTSGRLYFDGPQTRIATADARARAFAPVVLMGGSSLSHLEESAYPDGDPNALLTPLLASREAILEPGPILLAMLDDIGWGEAIAPTLETPTPTATPYAIRRFAGQVSSDGWRYPTATPSPVSTRAPAPAPTTTAAPFPGEAGVDVRHATWRIDEYGYLWIAGEVVNNRATSIGYVELFAEYRDVTGRWLGGAYAIETILPWTSPGADVPFLGLDTNPPPGVEHVSLFLVYIWPPTGQPPPTELAATITSRTLSAIGVLHIRGTVENTSSSETWRHVLPVTALYDTAGNMLLVEPQYLLPTSLGPGESGTFDWAINNPPPAESIGGVRTWIGILE